MDYLVYTLLSISIVLSIVSIIISVKRLKR